MKIGLVLSGGGARGFAHLGVMKALNESNIPIDIISGTSAGAIAGAFYAQGREPEEILDMITQTNLFKIFRLAINWRGLLNIEKSYGFFKEQLGVNTFEELDKPLVVAATNVKKGKSKFFYTGELIRPILASSCLPVIFDPVEIGGKLYIDGGVLNNLPVEPLIGHCDKIIAVHTNPINSKYKPDNMKELLERTFMMAINNNAYARQPMCDVFLEPKALRDYNVFDIKKAREIFDIGYEYTIKYFEKRDNLIEEMLEADA